MHLEHYKTHNKSTGMSSIEMKKMKVKKCMERIKIGAHFFLFLLVEPNGLVPFFNLIHYVTISWIEIKHQKCTRIHQKCICRNAPGRQKLWCEPALGSKDSKIFTFIKVKTLLRAAENAYLSPIFLQRCAQEPWPSSLGETAAGTIRFCCCPSQPMRRERGGARAAALQEWIGSASARAWARLGAP